MDIEEAFRYLNEAADTMWAVTISHSLYSETSERKLTIDIGSHAKPYPHVDIDIFLYPDRSAYRIKFHEVSRRKQNNGQESRGLCYDVSGKLFYIMKMNDDDRARLSLILTKLEDKMDASMPAEVWDFV